MHCVVRWTVTFLLAFAPHAADAAPLISEAFYDAVGSDYGLSFVELYGESGSSVDGLFLEGINGANGSAGPSIALSGICVLFLHRKMSPLTACQRVWR